jgi:hypothetical protein
MSVLFTLELWKTRGKSKPLWRSRDVVEVYATLEKGGSNSIPTFWLQNI